MKLPNNTFLEALRANKKPLIGCWLGLPDPNAAEIAAAAGFDWLAIDQEHAPFELSDVASHLRAIAPYPPAAIVRAASDDPTLIKKLLDLGAQSLLIPMIETGEQARACVNAVYYPPQGQRGVGTSLARAARWNGISDYVHSANEQIGLFVQVESQAAIDNLDDILAIESIDGVFIGPSDLAASMGKLGAADDEKVQQAISLAISKAQSAGKFAGILALSEGLQSQCKASGIDFIGVGVDTLLLRNGLINCRRQHD